MDGKSLEKRLKVAALSWACTLAPPTGVIACEPPPPPDGSSLYYLRDLVTFARCNTNILSSFLRL